MKNHIRFLLMVVLSSMLFVACNTAEEPSKEPAGDTITADSKINDQAETKEPVITNDPEQQENATDDTSISYTSKEKETSVKTSTIEGENYIIQAIPGFTLTAEEPGKDVLFYDKDDSVFMRIEAIPVNDSTFKDIVTNTEETMTAINSNYESFDLTPYVEKYSLKNSTAYKTTFENEKVIMAVIEKDDILVRLSIYDNAEADYTDAMVKMGLTIEAK